MIYGLLVIILSRVLSYDHEEPRIPGNKETERKFPPGINFARTKQFCGLQLETR